MKIQLKLLNIGPISTTKVSLKDLSIIVGPNSTGKSLISKTAYISLRGLNLNDNDLTQLLNEEVYKPQLYNEADEVSVNLKIDDDERLNIDFKSMNIRTKYTPEITETTYVSGPLVVNENFNNTCSFDHDNDLKCKLINKISLNEETTLKVEEINKLFDEIVDGHRLVLIEEGSHFGLKLENNLVLPMNKSPNGIKSFLILKELLNNGYLQENMILILDEPEILSHSSWQLSYAHILAKIIRYFKVKVVINTCSLFFIEALEMYSKSYNLDTDFYLGEKSEDGYSFKNRNNDIQRIYSTLLEPYEKLDDLKRYYMEES